MTAGPLFGTGLLPAHPSPVATNPAADPFARLRALSGLPPEPTEKLSWPAWAMRKKLEAGPVGLPGMIEFTTDPAELRGYAAELRVHGRVVVEGRGPDGAEFRAG